MHPIDSPQLLLLLCPQLVQLSGPCPASPPALSALPGPLHPDQGAITPRGGLPSLFGALPSAFGTRIPDGDEMFM